MVALMKPAAPTRAEVDALAEAMAGLRASVLELVPAVAAVVRIERELSARLEDLAFRSDPDGEAFDVLYAAVGADGVGRLMGALSGVFNGADVSVLAELATELASPALKGEVA